MCILRYLYVYYDLYVYTTISLYILRSLCLYYDLYVNTTISMSILQSLWTNLVVSHVAQDGERDAAGEQARARVDKTGDDRVPEKHEFFGDNFLWIVQNW